MCSVVDVDKALCGVPSTHTTMLVTALGALCLLPASSALQVVRQSMPSAVRDGEDATLFCEADEEFDSCYWYLPGVEGGKCGPLTPTQSMCR